MTETVQMSQDWPGAAGSTGDSNVDVDVEFGSPPPPPPPPASPAPPPAGPSWSDFQSDLPAGPAATETKRLIDELQAGRPVTPPTFPQTPQSPDATSWGSGDSTPPSEEPPRHASGGVFPTGEIPDYSPTPPDSPERAPVAPAAPPMPPVPAMPSVPPVPPSGVPPFELPPRPSVLDTFAEEPSDERRDHHNRSFGLVPLLLVLVVLAAAAYFVSTQLLGGSSEDTRTAPTRSTTPSARATAARPVPTYSAEQIAASLKDPHFKHGYDAGVLRKKAGAVEDASATCRAMGLRERDKGYGWGAHDQQGCIVGTTT
ncbi:MAG: hypothetical protein ABIO67_03325 [Mycobacteriales bacterium]